MKKYAERNWKRWLLRLIILVSLIALWIPGVSLAGDPTGVPEPNILLLLGSAFVGLGFVSRRLRQ